MAQVPQQKYSADEFYYKLYHFDHANKDDAVRKHSISQTNHMLLQAYTRKIFEEHKTTGKIQLIDLDKLFCIDGVCLMGDGEISKYKDSDHISQAGAFSLVSEIKKHINK